MMSTILNDYIYGNVAVVCNDAGAANIIINWLKNMPNQQVRVHLDGPAKELWRRAFPHIINFSLDDALDGSDMLISGTGWASDLEHNARIMALSKGLFTVGVIDHWVNYEARFSRSGQAVYPNEIWVVDEHSFSIAKSKFPDLIVRLLPNCYLDRQVSKIKELQKMSVSKAKRMNVLYALEPIRVSWKNEEIVSGEFQALDYFVSHIPDLTELPVKIRLRLHPSDSLNKYDAWIDEQNLNFRIEISKNKSLAEDLAWSDLVVGCQTYVLVIALTAGKRVLISLPPWAPSSLLPYPGIKELREMMAASK
ncbi:hypothetical protein OAN52_00505 [Amylibacter sp.]|jgi:hypothetical protein|nr:hypothetical protein [Amylibacter sp.]